MVIAAEASIETVAEDDQAKYVFVFTEAFTQRHGTAYTAVIGEKACINSDSKTISAVEGDLTTELKAV